MSLAVGLLLAAQLSAANVEPERPNAFGFTRGQRPVVLGAPPAGVRSHQAEACAACHRKVYDEWRTSRHSVSWTNVVFRQGFDLEPQRFCVHCHAPTTAQFNEVRAAYFKGQEVASDGLAHEGVTCAVCHSRDGRIVGSKGGVMGPHQHSVEPSFASAELCGSCHQFNFHELRNGEVELTDQPMQNTYNEWLAYRDAGGKGDCLTCHMPGGKHVFVGSHDVPMLRGALAVQLTTADTHAVLKLTSRGVGHHYPTGDLFRHLAVEVDRGSGFERILRLGRHYEARPRADGVGNAMTLVADTSLRPNEARAVQLPADARRYRVRYFYALERHVLLGNVAQSKLVTTLYEDAVPAAGKAEG